MHAISRPGWRARAALAVIVALMLTVTTTALALASTGAKKPLLQISSDPFTNSTSQHKTQVEPDTYSNGSTIVSAFQSGRFFDGGSSDIGWATSTDNGATWKNGFLPGTTPYSTPPGPYARVSDPSVAFDAKHNVWIVSYLGLTNGSAVDVDVSRSIDGGLTWSNPVAVNNSGPFFDKNWSVCDSTPSSPFYGNCYTEFDNVNQNDTEQMSTSTDGGITWGAAKAPSGSPHGLGGQPLTQPNGTVIVPFENLNGTISAFTSTNGGSSWTAAVTIATINVFNEPANIRTSPLPSAEIDGSGKVYVSWQDCRFESGCSANDIVYSTSSDGTHWSAVQRVPADPVGSGIDHFIPGFAVDKSTSGSSAHLAVTYYYFTNASCTSTCQLNVGYISSTNAGSSWSSSKQLAGPMKLTWLAQTNQGAMVGDYISTSFASNGKAYPVFAVAKKNRGSKFNEAMYTFKGGLPAAGGTLSSKATVLFSGQTPHSGHLTAF
jgi:hypothetical protein